MPKRVTAGQKPFKMLVAHFSGPTDPSKTAGQVVSKKAADKGGTYPTGEGSRIRKSFEMQTFVQAPNKGFQQQNPTGKTPGGGTRLGLQTYTTGVTPVAPTFTITVSALVVTMAGKTRIIFGDNTATPGNDFVVDAADTTVTATNLATYINGLEGYSAVPAGSVVTVSLPSGINYNNMLVTVTGPESGGYTIEPENGYPVRGEPYIGPFNIG